MKRYSILQEEKKCYVCGDKIVHIHEVFYGKNRNKSIIDGCCIYLCPKHHNMSSEGIHFNKELDLKVKHIMQKQWMKINNKTIDDFIKRYGRNYI